MKRKTAKIALFSVVVVLLLLGCKDAFHEPEWNPNSAPIVPDGKSYTVTFNRNGGSGTAPASISGESGASINLPYQGGLSRTNYAFSGWNTNASGTGTTFAEGAPFTVPNQDVTLYAKWDAVEGGGTHGGGGGGGSAPAVPTATVPDTPTNVTATAISSSSITVNWSSVSGASGYYVYRSSSPSSSFSRVGTSSSTSFTDTGLSPSTTYYYRVSAYNSAGESSQSASVSATTSSASSGSVPNTPTNVTATAISSTSIHISWTPSSGPIAEYFLVVRYGTAMATLLPRTTATSYTDTGLIPGQTYSYTVAACYGTDVCSFPSSPVSATTTLK